MASGRRTRRGVARRGGRRGPPARGPVAGPGLADVAARGARHPSRGECSRLQPGGADRVPARRPRDSHRRHDALLHGCRGPRRSAVGDRRRRSVRPGARTRPPDGPRRTRRGRIVQSADHRRRRRALRTRANPCRSAGGEGSRRQLPRCPRPPCRRRAWRRPRPSSWRRRRPGRPAVNLRWRDGGIRRRVDTTDDVRRLTGVRRPDAVRDAPRRERAGGNGDGQRSRRPRGLHPASQSHV